MIVLDIDILLYVYDTEAPEHDRARDWFERVLSGDETIGLPWQTISAFLRIATYPKLKGERFTMRQAVAIVDQWLQRPRVCILNPGEEHWRLYRKMLLDGDARGKLAPDAQLAALSTEYGGVLYSNDRDFARFPGLRWVNPLLES